MKGKYYSRDYSDPNCNVKYVNQNLIFLTLQANGEPGVVTQTLDVGSIRSVKVSKEGRRNIPKAFEIFTADKTFILKAKDGSNAQEWVQCLSVAKAHNQVCLGCVTGLEIPLSTASLLLPKVNGHSVVFDNLLHPKTGLLTI